MQREYDVLETFVEEQSEVPRQEHATSYLLRSKDFPKFSERVKRERTDSWFLHFHLI